MSDRLHFEFIRWKNLLATGNQWTEIRLDRSPSTLIVGDNGAGKSTLLDALCFVNYGKPYRKVKLAQLINSINLGELVVEEQFKTNGKTYLIRRGMRPTVFEVHVDGVLVDQNGASKDYQTFLEKNILRLNMKSFVQVVVLGSSGFVPFMQMSPGQRREVIEDLLDIKVFSTMASIVKDRFVGTKEGLVGADRDEKSLRELIAVQERHRTVESDQRSKRLAEINARLSEVQRDLETTQAAMEQHAREVRDHQLEIADAGGVRCKHDGLLKVKMDLEQKIESTRRVVQFFETANNCPTCTQGIDERTRAQKTEEKGRVLEEVEAGVKKLETVMGETSQRLKQIEHVQLDIEQVQYEITRVLSPKQTADLREIKVLNDQIATLSRENTAVSDEKLNEHRLRLEGLLKEKDRLLNERELLTVGGFMLKDGGIKSLVVKQYVPLINTLVNKYLAAMDFFVRFELNEQFEERILSRHRDDFTYESFSEGEKMRIDLSLLFAWRAVARLKNSANTNLLILDEVFDGSLDPNGCDEFFKLIQAAENTNVFCISHKSDQLLDKFRSVIRFQKISNYSVMVNDKS